MSSEIEYKDPVVDWETRAYWEACARHELTVQRCGACGKVQHRPRAICASCLSGEVETRVASGRGTVHTFTIVRQNQVPPFASACPYVLAYVDLEEGPRLLTNIVDCEPDSVAVGMPVQVEFVDTGEFAVPRFRPA